MTIKQPKKERIKSGPPFVSIDSNQFLNNSSDTLVQDFGENDFYILLSQKLNVNVLHYLKKKHVFSL